MQKKIKKDENFIIVSTFLSIYRLTMLIQTIYTSLMKEEGKNYEIFTFLNFFGMYFCLLQKFYFKIHLKFENYKE